MVKEETWVKVAEIKKLNKLEENMEIYHPIEELLKENKIKYRYKIEEGLNYNEANTVKGVKNIFFINLYVEPKNERRVQQIIKEYENADSMEEELIDAEDEVVQKTIPAIVLPYIYVVLFGITIIIASVANFENMVLKIIGGVIGGIIIIYAIKSVIQKILKRKK